MTQVLASGAAERVAYRYSVLARQTPLALVGAAAIIAAFALLNLVTGVSTVEEQTLNLPVLAVLALGAWVAGRAALPRAALPWLVASLSAAVVFVLAWQARDAGTGSGYAYVLVALALYPSLTMFWLPVIVMGVPMLGASTWATQAVAGEPMSAWMLVTLAAWAIGLLLMLLRTSVLDDLGRATAELRAAATHDELTGVLNRHGIEEQVPTLLGLAERHDEGVFAMFVDVDGLKQANDEHGHDTGDMILRAVGSALAARVRVGDVVGRWGGDEFIVVGLGRAEDPDSLAARVRDHVRATGLDPSLWDGAVSAGTAAWSSEETAERRSEGFPALLAEADADMYRRRRMRRA